MKTIIAAILAFILAINHSSAVDVDCDIQDNVWTPFGTFKECLAYNVVSKEPGQKLEEVNTYSRSLEELRSFYIYLSPSCYYLPSGIEEKFPNLKTLIVAHTGLVSITKEDLKPFENIRGLYIDYSKISAIQGDLFHYNRNLRQLSLKYNQISYVEPDSFKFLAKLTSLDFEGNPCFSDKAEDRDNVEDLIADIERKCNVREIGVAKIESTTEIQNKLNSNSEEKEKEED